MGRFEVSSSIVSVQRKALSGGIWADVDRRNDSDILMCGKNRVRLKSIEEFGNAIMLRCVQPVFNRILWGPAKPGTQQGAKICLLGHERGTSALTS